MEDGVRREERKTVGRYKVKVREGRGLKSVRKKAGKKCG